MSRLTQTATLALILLAVIALLFQVFATDSRHLHRYTLKVERFLHEREAEADKYLSQIAFSPDLTLQEPFLEKPWGLTAYNITWHSGDSLLLSLNNQYLPETSPPENTDTYFLHEDNTTIYIGKRISGATPQAIVWLPIWEDFEMENPILKKGFTGLPNIPEEVIPGGEVSEFSIAGREGQAVVFLKALAPFSDPLERGIFFSLVLGISVVIGFLIQRIALHLSRKRTPWWGLFFLMAFMVITRSILNPFISPGAEVDWMPALLKEPILQQTLAGLLLNTFFLLWLLLFFYQKFETLRPPKLSKPLSIFLSGINYLAILLGMLLIAQTIRNIVIFSSLNVYWENLFAIDSGGILAIGVLVLLFLAFFLFSHRMGRVIVSMGLKPVQRMLALSLSLAAVIPFYIWANIHFPLVLFLLASIVYLVILDLFSELESPNLTWLIIWLMVFSGLTAMLLSSFNLEKEDQIQQEMAVRLTTTERSVTDETLAPKGAFEDYFQSTIPGRGIEKKMEYALYHRGILVEKTGFDGNSGDEQAFFERVEADSLIKRSVPGQVDWVYNNSNGYSAIVSRSVAGLIRPISVFSYLLALFILIMPLLALLNYWLRFLPYNLDFTQFHVPSLSNRIQLWIVGFLLISFFIIGFFSIWNFRQTANFNQEVLLKEKIEDVQKDAQQRIQQIDTLIAAPLLSDILTGIGRLRKMDLLAYAPNGHFTGSTLSPALERALAPARLNGTTYYQFTKGGESFDLQREQIGNLHYRTAYLPILSPEGEPRAFIGLPFVDKASLWQQELSGFISTLINVYVFLLLLAGAFAIFIANSITQPISRLGDSLRELKLGKNEPLSYDRKDELGTLIEEYNRTLRKLEESSQKLAQSERDFAWREMAKQVAHEIKNPLTPMKLKVQQLQLAMKAKPEKTLEMIPPLAQTILHQIQTLDDIASAFSNFAKLPEPKNALFSLTKLIGSVHTLFRNDQSELDMAISLPKEDYQVLADESHLTRVFNNIYKNAIQAIPPDRKGKITTRLFQRDGFAVVQISDNGSGIPEDMLEKVFEPNFTTKSSGSGLGMAISKNIVTLAKGQLYFETETDRGTDFFVELPLSYRPE